jgi:hypothetical protein
LVEEAMLEMIQYGLFVLWRILLSVRFNGIDLKTGFGFETEDIEISPPRIRKNVVTIPGVHGVIDFGGTYEERDIFIRGHLADAFDHAAVLDNSEIE